MRHLVRYYPYQDSDTWKCVHPPFWRRCLPVNYNALFRCDMAQTVEKVSSTNFEIQDMIFGTFHFFLCNGEGTCGLGACIRFSSQISAAP